MRQLYERPSSTLILRKIRDAAIAATEHGPEYTVIHGCTLHFFKDCILAITGFSKDGRIQKYFTVYSEDRGKTWKPYINQFEPAEGYHAAAQYEHTTDTFPTKYW